MNGLDIRSPGSFSGGSWARYADDRDEALAPGVLALVVPSHSSRPMTTGVSSGQVVPNIAVDHARALIGTADANVDFALTLGTGRTAQSSRFERTGKGAIHGIMSQANNGAQYQGANIRPAGPAITNYIKANPSHDYYFSMLTSVTRPAIAGGSVFPMIGQVNNTADPFDVLYRVIPTYTDGQGVYSAASATRKGFYASPTPAGSAGTGLVAAQLGGWAPVGTPAIDMFAGVWGELQTYVDLNGSLSAQVRNKSASFILYRFMLEDLTASGRTFDEVVAIDQRIREREFSAGGLFYGDTYTSPAALP